QHDGRCRHLAEPAVGKADDDDVAYRLVPAQDVGDLLRQDLEAAPVDGVVGAAFQEEKPVTVDPRQVRRPDPAGADARRTNLEQPRAADRAGSPVLLVEDAKRDAGSGPADAAAPGGREAGVIGAGYRRDDATEL